MLEEPEELAGCFQALLRLPLIGSEALLMFAGGSQQFDLSSQMLRAWFVYQIRSEDLVHQMTPVQTRHDVHPGFRILQHRLPCHLQTSAPTLQRWGSREAGEAIVATSPAILGLKDIPLWPRITGQNWEEIFQSCACQRTFDAFASWHPHWQNASVPPAMACKMQAKSFRNASC